LKAHFSGDHAVCHSLLTSVLLGKPQKDSANGKLGRRFPQVMRLSSLCCNVSFSFAFAFPLFLAKRRETKRNETKRKKRHRRESQWHKGPAFSRSPVWFFSFAFFVVLDSFPPPRFLVFFPPSPFFFPSRKKKTGGQREEKNGEGKPKQKNKKKVKEQKSPKRTSFFCILESKNHSKNKRRLA
jgi:hypothetical protein